MTANLSFLLFYSYGNIGFIKRVFEWATVFISYAFFLRLCFSDMIGINCLPTDSLENVYTSSSISVYCQFNTQAGQFIYNEFCAVLVKAAFYI